MQDVARAAEAPTAHHDGPLEDPLEQLEGARLPRAGSVLFEGVRLPRAGFASLEGPLRPRTGSASLEGTPRTRACSHTRAFNALTPAARRHHAPGARAPVPPHQLPRREPIPITVGGGGAWAARPGPGPGRRAACSGTANAPSPRRGVGCTLDLLSCDLTGLGGGARPVGRHPCHCYGMAAALARTGARQVLWQRLQHCGACGNGTPTLLATVLRTGRRQRLPQAYLKTSQPSAALLPSRPPLFGYKICHDGQIAARSPGRPPTLQRSTPRSLT
jgi:hypothetical protein